jgi:hypothetical protein
MTREQYEEQKRRLAEQHRPLVETVGSAYQAQLRALEMVWRMLSGEGAGGLRPPPTSAAASPQPAAPAPPGQPRRKARELAEDVSAVFPQLPEVFTFNDVCRLLGYAPKGGSLYRVLQEMRIEERIATASFGRGTKPAQYREQLVGDAKAKG